MPEIKRVTLHPLKSDGTVDTSVNLYPKTLVDGIVDRNGNPVDIATQVELNEAVNFVEDDINTKVTEINSNIRVINRNINALDTEVTDIAEEVAKKVNIGEVDLNEYLNDEQLSELVKFLDKPTYFVNDNWNFTKQLSFDSIKDCQVVKCHYKGLYKEDDQETNDYYVEGDLYFNRTNKWLGDQSVGEPLFVYNVDNIYLSLNSTYLNYENVSNVVDVDVDLSIADTIKLEKFLNQYPYTVQGYYDEIEVNPLDTVNAYFKENIESDWYYNLYDTLNIHFNLYENSWMWDSCHPAIEGNNRWQEGQYVPHHEPPEKAPVEEGSEEQEEPNYNNSYSKYQSTNKPSVYRYEIFADDRFAENIKEEYYWEDEFGNEHTALKLNYQNNGIAYFTFTLPSKCIGRVYIRADMDNFNQAANKDKAVVGSNGVSKNILYINGNQYIIEEDYSRIKYKQWFSEEVTGDNRSNNWYIPWIDAYEFNEGEYTIEFVATDTGNLTIYSIVLVIDEEAEQDIYCEKELNYITFNKLGEFDGYDKWSCSGAFSFADDWDQVRAKVSLTNSGIIGTRELDIPIKQPNLEFDDNDKPIDDGKFLQLSYNSAYDKFEYIHTSAQAPINDLNQIRQAAYDYMQNGASKSYVKSKINDFKASENYWTAAQHFSASIYADLANINTLYGSNNVSKPVSQIALLSDIPSVSEYASISYVDSVITALSSVYAPVGSYATVEELVSKQNVPAIEEDEYFIIPAPIFSVNTLQSSIEGLDVELAKKLIGDFESGERYHQYIDNFGEVWELEATSETSADVVIIVGDKKYTTSFFIETDETGFSQVIVDGVSVDNIAAKSDIPTKTSQLTNDSGYITNSAISDMATETWVNQQDFAKESDIPDVSGFVNEQELQEAIADLVNEEYLDKKLETKQDIPAIEED